MTGREISLGPATAGARGGADRHSLRGTTDAGGIRRGRRPENGSLNRRIGNERIGKAGRAQLTAAVAGVAWCAGASSALMVGERFATLVDDLARLLVGDDLVVLVPVLVDEAIFIAHSTVVAGIRRSGEDLLAGVAPA